MKDLSFLRQLVEYKQYDYLITNCIEQLEQNSNLSKPVYDEINILLSLAYAYTGDKNLSEKLLIEIINHQQQLNNNALCDLAAIYMQANQIEKAIELLEPIILNQPEYSLASARLAWCHMVQENYDKALSLFSSAIKLRKDYIALYINKIQIYFKKKLLEQAEKDLRLAFSTLYNQQTKLPETVYNDYQQRLNSQQLQYWAYTQGYAQAEQWLDDLKDNNEEAYLFSISQYALFLAEQDQHKLAHECLIQALEKYPDNIALLVQLSEISQLLGYAFQALKCLKQAIKVQADNSSLWAKLALASLQQNPQQAKQAAEKSLTLAKAQNKTDKIDFKEAEATHAIAMIESHEQNYQQAEQLFNEILLEFPQYLPALQGLAQQNMQQGNIDRAVELFEQIKKINPVQGHIGLINAHLFPEDNETLEKLEKAAYLPSLQGSVQCNLLFQLAAAWQKKKNYDKAFTLAKEANDFTQKFLNYQPKKHRQACARIRYAFSKSLYQHRPKHGIRSKLPIFVVGMPRSGTTLVEQIIASHSQIFGAGELGLIPQTLQGLNRWERHTGSGRQYPDCIDDLSEEVSHKIASNLLKELQSYSPESQYIVDKLPHNFEHIGLIKFLFPQAKIISVRRDPRDIALSNYFTNYLAKHSGMSFAYNLKNIGEQLADHNLLMHHWHQVFPNEILEIHYEDIVDNTEASARKMLAYIGVDWEAEVLNFNQLERSVKTASLWQVRQPIYKSSKAKWKNYEAYLAPLIKGTNAKIVTDKIDMISLPTPGLLTSGVACFKKGELDKAEENFKKLLFHIPEHAAANFMLGTIYVEKGYHSEGIELMEKGLKVCPWNKNWQQDLNLARKISGQEPEQKSEASEVQKHNPKDKDDEWLNTLLQSTEYSMPS